MPLKTFDTIIVGAGPAGSLCAHELARKGHSVVVLEKERLPRYKVCGGALSRRAEEVLPFSIEPVVERRAHELFLTLDGERPLSVESEKPFAAMVMRSALDHYLIREAQKKGALLMEGSRVCDLRQDDSGVSVTTEDRKEIKAAFLVGADGVFSLVGRILGLNQKQKRGPAIGGEISVASSFLSEMKGSAHVDAMALPGGYGWIFPKMNHLTIGLGQFRGKDLDMMEAFQAFLSKWNLVDKSSIKSMRVSSIPLGGAIGDLVHGRALLIGDAGGLVDPLYGEGLYYALRSAKIASQVILSQERAERPSLYEYQRMVKAEFGPEFRSSSRLFHLFYHFASVAHQVLERNPEIVRYLLEMVSGRISPLVFYEHIKGYIPIIKKLVMV